MLFSSNTFCQVLLNWMQWTNILIMLGVFLLSGNYLKHPNLVIRRYHSCLNTFEIHFEGKELKLYLDRNMSIVISDGLKISNDFEINHFEFWVEFNMEGFPVQARNIVQTQTKRVLEYFKDIFIYQHISG